MLNKKNIDKTNIAIVQNGGDEENDKKSLFDKAFITRPDGTEIINPKLTDSIRRRRRKNTNASEMSIDDSIASTTPRQRTNDDADIEETTESIISTPRGEINDNNDDENIRGKQFKTASAEEYKSLIMEHQRLSDENKTISDSMSLKKTEMSSLKTEFDILEKTKSTIANDIASIESEKLILSKKLELLKTENESLKTENESFEKKLKILKTKISHRETTLSEKDAQIKTIEQDLETKRQELDSVSKEVKTLTLQKQNQQHNISNGMINSNGSDSRISSRQNSPRSQHQTIEKIDSNSVVGVGSNKLSKSSTDVSAENNSLSSSSTYVAAIISIGNRDELTKSGSKLPRSSSFKNSFSKFIFIYYFCK